MADWESKLTVRERRRLSLRTLELRALLQLSWPGRSWSCRWQRCWSPSRSQISSGRTLGGTRVSPGCPVRRRLRGGLPPVRLRKIECKIYEYLVSQRPPRQQCKPRSHWWQSSLRSRKLNQTSQLGSTAGDSWRKLRPRWQSSWQDSFWNTSPGKPELGLVEAIGLKFALWRKLEGPLRLLSSHHCFPVSHLWRPS